MRLTALSACLFIFFLSCSKTRDLALPEPEIVMDKVKADEITVMENGDLYGITNNNTIFAHIGGREYYLNQALGDGPGEFSHVTLLDSCKDRLYIYDEGNSRFSLYAPDRGFVNDIPANESVLHFSVFHETIFCVNKYGLSIIPDSAAQTATPAEKSALPLLIHAGGDYIMLGCERPFPKIEVYGKDIGHLRTIRLKNRPTHLTDLTADEDSGLIFAATFGISAKKRSVPQIRILDMAGGEKARVTLPLQKEGTTALRIAVDKHNHTLYAADGSNIYRIDYKTVLAE